MQSAVGFIGYCVDFIGFITLLLLIFTHKNKHSFIRSVLAVSILLSAIWALSTAILLKYPYPVEYNFIAESIRNLSWFVLIFSTISYNNNLRSLLLQSKGPTLVLLTTCLLLLLEITTLFSNFFVNQIFVFHLLQSLIGLWLVESLFRKTVSTSRWTVKPLCMGLGLIFAYDFAYYSNALLTQTIPINFLYARAWVVVIAIPLILLSIRRVTDWSIRIYVSRDVIFHSSLLLAAGGYLLVMALAGYYIQYIGNSWGNILQIFFFSMSLFILVALFLSEKLQRKIKVFIAKHFFANKYEYREEWTKFARQLNNSSDNPYQTALTTFITPFKPRYGVLLVKEGPRFIIKATHNINRESLTQVNQLNFELSELAIEHQWIVSLREVIEKCETTPFDFDTTKLDQKQLFEYIIPLSNPSGFKAVCLLSPLTSTDDVNWEDRDLMRAISIQVTNFLHLHISNQELSESKQFDAFNRMSAFLVHDLKNVVTQLQLLSTNAVKHRDNPEFIDDAFDTVDSSVIRLNKMLSQLKQKQINSTSETLTSVLTLLNSAVIQRQSCQPSPTIDYGHTSDCTIFTDPTRLLSVFCHLIQNAQEATSTAGSVIITTASNDTELIITLSDTGIGMSDDFITNRLFKPFDTTKGNAGMGIGVYDANQYIQKINGYLSVTSVEGEGTVFTMHFPISSD
ncbi:MAG: PEP-CTERM system histidine kinase PrsK [Aliivibrio sp.]|uniref:XrtA/PEP-CTERM system histidine kinase PrsK n=1 Tax=Aliivibrio sp. TaxID=1872443 RepID=UPI001A38F609|nr:PEP-CTERM system histidine kinase PrsK [Aliivibrio sp.]